MDGIILLTVFFCGIALNILNVYKTIRLRREKKYITHIAIPSLIFALSEMLLAIFCMCSENIVDCMDVMIFINVIVQSIFSLIITTIVTIKCLSNKDGTYLPILLFYGITIILVPVANIICSIITYIVYVVFKITHKEKKPLYSYLRND